MPPTFSNAKPLRPPDTVPSGTGISSAFQSMTCRQTGRGSSGIKSRSPLQVSHARADRAAAGCVLAQAHAIEVVQCAGSMLHEALMPVRHEAARSRACELAHSRAL